MIRPLTAADAPLVGPLAARAFDDLLVREGRPLRPRPPERLAHYAAQYAHVVATGRALGAFDDGDRLVGAALSTVRGDLWLLPLLVVEPDAQSAGTGRALLSAVLDGAPARRVLHASSDARALRAYARAGFRLLPALEATGTVARGTGPAVVAGTLPDAFAVDAAHLRAAGGEVLALADGREGVAVVHRVPGRGSGVTVLSAADDATAADLLRGVLATLEGAVEVGPLAPQAAWAVPVLLDAGLDLAPGGPVCVAGPGDPLAGPCAPDGVFL